MPWRFVCWGTAATAGSVVVRNANNETTRTNIRNRRELRTGAIAGAPNFGFAFL
jgi:hypothetical protein